MQKILIDKKTGKIKVQTINNEPSLTQQQFKDQTDINKIMKQYESQGINYNSLPQSIGVYADMTIIPKDYQETLKVIQQAEEAFMSLPPELRAQYQNNPQNLVDWLQNPANNEKAVELGLKNKPTQPPAPPTAPPEPPKTP